MVSSQRFLFILPKLDLESSRDLARAMGRSSGYELLRMIWHLLPLNAASYVQAVFVAGSAIPDGSLIVFFDTDEWRTQGQWRRMLAHSEHLATSVSIHGDSFEDDRLVVFRFRRGR